MYQYPYTEFEIQLTVFAFWTNSESGVKSPAPLLLLFNPGNIPGYDMTVDAQGAYQMNNTTKTCGDNSTGFTITVSWQVVTALQRVLIAIIIIFWLLAAGMLAIAMVQFSAKEGWQPPTDALAAAGALLFAFPTIRGFWPLVPPMGTSLDIIGLFAPMSVVALAALIIMGQVVSDAFARQHGRVV